MIYNNAAHIVQLKFDPSSEIMLAYCPCTGEFKLSGIKNFCHIIVLTLNPFCKLLLWDYNTIAFGFAKRVCQFSSFIFSGNSQIISFVL